MPSSVFSLFCSAHAVCLSLRMHSQTLPPVHAEPLPTAAIQRQRWLVAVLVLLHALLLIHDLADPQAWRAGDRSWARAEKIEYVLHGDQPMVFEHLPRQQPEPDIWNRITRLGAPGDFLPQTALVAVGGIPLLVLVQSLLAVISAVFLYRLIMLLGLSSGPAVIGTAIYALLPGNLLQAHVLGAEGLFIPLLPISAYWVVAALRGRAPSHWLYRGAALFGIAALLRTQMVLLPLVFLLLALVWAPRRWHRILVLATALTMAPNLIWVGLASLADEPVRMAPVDADTSYHWRHRIWRMNKYIPEAEAMPSPTKRDRVETSTLLAYIAEHPGAYLRTVLTDNLDYIGNPGSVQFVRYLGVLGEMPDPEVFKAAKDRGVAAVIQALLDWNAAFTVFFAVHIVLWGAVLLLAAFGMWQWLRAPLLGSPWSTALLIAYFGYNLAVIQLAGHSRWSLRQPLEWVLVLAALSGALPLLRSRREAHPS